MKLKSLKAAFPYTIPIMAGYMFLGIAYGFLMKTKGFGLGMTVFTSIVVFAGSMQYVGLTLLTAAFNPVYTLFLTLMINARHLFYGISMLKKYQGSGKLKNFLIFGLVDETFSINCSTQPPAGIDKTKFYFFVTLLNYIYWVSWSAAGNILGNFITFNTKGLDFVLTALFVVIFINQWKERKKHSAALIGLISPIICLLIFGQDRFIIPSMLLIITVLIVFRSRIDKEAE